MRGSFGRLYVRCQGELALKRAVWFGFVAAVAGLLSQVDSLHCSLRVQRLRGLTCGVSDVVVLHLQFVPGCPNVHSLEVNSDMMMPVAAACTAEGSAGTGEQMIPPDGRW